MIQEQRYIYSKRVWANLDKNCARMHTNNSRVWKLDRAVLLRNNITLNYSAPAPNGYGCLPRSKGIWRKPFFALVSSGKNPISYKQDSIHKDILMKNTNTKALRTVVRVKVRSNTLTLILYIASIADLPVSTTNNMNESGCQWNIHTNLAVKVFDVRK